MRKFLITLLLAVSLFSLNTRATLPSVMPLQDQAGRTFCTAFSINDVEHLWATAGHCAAIILEGRAKGFIDGQFATPIYVWFDERHDMAVLQSGAAAPALKLSKDTPVVGQFVEVRGFPYGLPALVVTTGTMASRNMYLEGAPVSDILTAVVAGGNSGSPVLNERGEVIGILWGVFTQSGHSLAIPHETLKQFLKPFWSR